MLTTLCYIENDGKYLMLHRVKKENDVNKDKWIGIGGKLEDGESPEEGICREVLEETGLTLLSYRLRGFITFVDDAGWQEYMCLFTADGYEGDIKECDEGELAWVEKEAVCTLPIWEGDKLFLSLLEQDAPFFSLKLLYGEGGFLREAALDGKELGREDMEKMGLHFQQNPFFR